MTRGRSRGELTQPVKNFLGGFCKSMFKLHPKKYTQVYGSTEKVASALRGKAVGRSEGGRLLQNSRWQGFAVPTMDDLGNCPTMEEYNITEREEECNARIF